MSTCTITETALERPFVLVYEMTMSQERIIALIKEKKASIPEQTDELRRLVVERMGSEEARPHIIIRYNEGSILVYTRLTEKD